MTFTCHFNPRPPWGGRLTVIDKVAKTINFNPRPPWGGRPVKAHFKASRILISIHALRGEGDFRVILSSWLRISISIHALRGEGDSFQVFRVLSNDYFNPRPPWGGRLSSLDKITINIGFQSTPSVGRATLIMCYTGWRINISIHALRGEGDNKGATNAPSLRYFNPRPPWGGRHFRPFPSFRTWKFQSTPSVGRATR